MNALDTATTFVLPSRLPWLDVPFDLPEAGQTFDRTLVHAGGRTVPAAIRSISPVGATLGGEVCSAPGELVAVELESGQRLDADVLWTGASQAGVRFRRPLDVVALITRRLVSQPVERRTMPRVEIRCSAWLRLDGRFLTALIRNISAGGLQVEGDDLPQTGERLQLFVEGLGVPPGELIWRRDRLAGMRFDRPLSWQDIMPWIRGNHRPR